MAYYWTCSSVYGLGCNLALRSPRLRRMCGIPKTENESSHPYRDMVKRARNKFRKRDSKS